MYNEEHGVTFGKYHSWRDWHLVPSSRPVIAPPKERTNYVTVPGRDGAWDLSQSVAGRAVYDDREGSLEFYVENGYWDWNTAYTTILNALAGTRLDIVLDDDPTHAYHGACWLDQWKSNKGHSTIVIKYRFAPYRKESDPDRWLWRPFNFYTDVVRSSVAIPVKGTRSITVAGSRKANCAVVTIVSGPITLTAKKGVLDGTTWVTVYDSELSIGDTAEIKMEDGQTYRMDFSGTGTVQIKYEGGKVL